MKTKNCVNCGKEFSPGARNFDRAMSCSGRCNLKQWRAKNPEHNRQIKQSWRRRNGVIEFGSPEHREKVSQQLRGTSLPEATKEKQRGSALRGTSHHAWKGDRVGYRALHRWVELYLGKPGDCEYCEATGLSGRSIHWANISHEYRRDLNDWMRLCIRCHRAYDSGKIEVGSL